jgi:hypothetical protein
LPETATLQKNTEHKGSVVRRDIKARNPFIVNMTAGLGGMEPIKSCCTSLLQPYTQPTMSIQLSSLTSKQLRRAAGLKEQIDALNVDALARVAKALKVRLRDLFS